MNHQKKCACNAENPSAAQTSSLMAKENDPSSADSDQEMIDGIPENSVKDMGAVLTGSRHLIHCLTVIGQIEGHYILPPQNKTTKYEHVIPQLAAIEESEEIKGLLILLNTVAAMWKQVLQLPN